MAQRPVLETERLNYDPVTAHELNEGLNYAATDRPEVFYKRGPKNGQVRQKAYVGQMLDRDMLEVFANTVLERRTPRSKLALLAATVVREKIKSTEQSSRDRIDAYKGAIMKMMSDRAVKKRYVDARKRIKRPPKPKASEHAEDPRRKGQLLLL